MNIQLIRPELLDSNFQVSKVPREQTEFNYTGIAIEDVGRYYYWAMGVSIEITQYEYECLKTNPKIYYFSSALKMHLKIKKALHYFDNQGNYEDPKTYEILEKVQVMLHTFIEKRRRLSNGETYHFSYGYLSNEYSGRISQDVYEMLKDSVVFEIEDGWVINRKTSEKFRQVQES